jgi:phenylacetate-CoA ligase
VGDYAVCTSSRCACGRTHVRAVGAFAGRADELINLRGIKMYPVELEQAVRSIPGVGDEYEIVLATTRDGLDVMTARVEHRDPSIAPALAREIQARCEVRAEVEVLAHGTLPKTEFKAKRIRDTRTR